MIEQSVAYLKEKGREVFYDAEHFFDGYKANPEYALACARTAYEAGARWVVLCDTNGGALPHEVERIVAEVTAHVPGSHLAIHAHNDTDQAVAVSLAAVRAGAREAYLLPEPLLAALGAGLPISTPAGNMIFNLGGGAGVLKKRWLAFGGRPADLETRIGQGGSSGVPSRGPGPRFGGKTKQIVEHVARTKEEGAAAVLATRQAARMQSLLQEAAVP